MMKTREVKFKAFIPKLGIMLTEIGIYFGSDQIGCTDDHLKELIKGKFYVEEDEGKIYNASDIHTVDPIMDILVGEDWYWIEMEDVVLLEWTGEKTKTGIEIYEGDKIRQKLLDKCEPEGFFWWEAIVTKHRNGAWTLNQVGFDYTGKDFEEFSLLSEEVDSIEIIGNIHKVI